MKGQWGLISALIFALIVAVFAVINVDAVTVDYLFGTAQWPLVLIILASALVGGLAVFGFGIFRIFRMRRKIRVLTKENHQLKSEAEQDQTSDEAGTKTERAQEPLQSKENGKTDWDKAVSVDSENQTKDDPSTKK